MIVMYRRTLITKFLFFIIIKPPLYKRLEVDTQQLNVPKTIISNLCSAINIILINYFKQALKDKVKLKSSGLDKNCKYILILMTENPFCYLPSYEKLSGYLNGLYSRRINRQHRIVYEADEEKKRFILLECGHIMINYSCKYLRL